MFFRATFIPVSRVFAQLALLGSSFAKRIPLLFSALAGNSPELGAAEPGFTPTTQFPAAIDKRDFNLFHPTPSSLLRELATDRPDRTEAPFTVDAGHFQLEMDILNYGYDRNTPERDQVHSERVSIAPINLKLGLLNNVDLQLGLETYTSTRAHDHQTGIVETHRGFGVIVPRLKVNFWGNDGGRTAAGLISFLKLPTSQDHLDNSHPEGGVILPFAMSLPAQFNLGLMTELDATHNVASSGYHPESVNTITLGHDIVGNLGGYAEFFSLVSFERNSPLVATIDFGLTYGLTENVQLDAGINLGVTRAAADLNPFVGLSWRF